MSDTYILVCHLPRRKRPVLSEVTDGVITPLGYFTSEEAAHRFVELAREGLFPDGEEEDDE